MNNRISGLRRSHVVTTYGPGAIIDFRAPSGAALSGVLSGLEEWDLAAPPKKSGLAHDQKIHEERLEKRLHVSGFRLPPVKPEKDKTWKKSGKQDLNDILPVVRFPEWLQCPDCGQLARSKDWSNNPGSPERWCTNRDCTTAGKKVFAVPVRFIVACEDGHLDEFPWTRWIRCRCERPRLKMKTEGPGLAGKWVRCLNDDCKGNARTMEGCFSKEALKSAGITSCSAREPWLPGSHTRPGTCERVPRALQRGASNVYYGDVRSSLAIPPFSGDLYYLFAEDWTTLRKFSRALWPAVIDDLDLVKKTGRPKEMLLAKLDEWKKALDADSEDLPIEWPEYLQFQNSLEEPVEVGEFKTRPTDLPAELSPWFAGVVQAQRLREVRVQVGFTRIHPPSGAFGSADQKLGKLYTKKPNWLPAIELRGEGIFLSLAPEALHTWESQALVQKRVERLQKLVAYRLSDKPEPPPVSLEVTARFVLIHSLAHALMRRLSLDCGYSSSALRERLYVGEGDTDMYGLLIHTGSPDSEGTLGGLVRQGERERLWETFRGAMQEMAWCSSDPVCISGTATLSSPDNGAACHACLLVPETCCQHFNVLLDRALLIGDSSEPSRKGLGFFEEFLSEYGL